MDNDQFDQFLMDTIKNFGESYIDVPDNMNEPVEFSKRFERKMRRIMRKSCRFSLSKIELPEFKLSDLKKLKIKPSEFKFPKIYIPRVKLTPKRIIVIAMSVSVAVSTMTSNVSAGPVLFDKFMVDYNLRFSIVTIEKDDNAPTDYLYDYKLNYIPEGFEYTSLGGYYNLRYQNEDKIFDFFVEPINMFRGYFWGYDIEPTIFNGYEAFTVNAESYEKGEDCKISLIWTDGEYVYGVVGDIDIDTAYKIADSVQKVER